MLRNNNYNFFKKREQFKYLKTKHSFHFVDPSPWPFVASFGAFMVTSGTVLYMYKFLSGGNLALTGFCIILYVMYTWWRYVIREATFEEQRTAAVQRGFRLKSSIITNQITGNSKILMGSNINNQMFMVRNRFYHSTTVISAPEWLLGLGKLFGIGKAAPVCPSPTPPSATFPGIDGVGPIKVFAHSVVSSLTDPIVWKFVLGVSYLVAVYAIIGSSYTKFMSVVEINHVYNQILMDPSLLNFLNDSYPTLNLFNEHSAGLICSKSLYQLSYEQCEIIVKFCIHTKNHMIFGVLIDTTNMLNI